MEQFHPLYFGQNGPVDKPIDFKTSFVDSLTSEVQSHPKIRRGRFRSHFSFWRFVVRLGLLGSGQDFQLISLKRHLESAEFHIDPRPFLLENRSLLTKLGCINPGLRVENIRTGLGGRSVIC